MDVYILAHTVAVAFLATLFAMWLLKPLARKIGFVDKPGGHKHHEGHVPIIGGIAIFFGFFFTLLSLPIPLEALRGLLAGSLLLLIVGAVDDIKNLSFKLRLLVQALAVFIMISVGDNSIFNLGYIWPHFDLHLKITGYVLTTLVVVGFINSMNMIDGQDGLAGGVALGQSALLFFLALVTKNNIAAFVLLIIAVSLLVFLFFNLRAPWRKKASVFLGDAGSTFLAFIVAWYAISLGQVEPVTIKPITVIWILAYPVFDFVNVFIRRLRFGRSVFRPSHDHLHHIIRIAGLKTELSTLFLVTMSFILGLMGVVLSFLGVPEWYQLGLLLFFLVLYIYFVKLISTT